MNIKPFTNLDFFDIKKSLIAFLKTQENFKDYNFEGSNLNVLLDILSYNSYQNNFYANMAISEMFLDSAQLKNSVISHAKELNYLPSSKTAASALINVSLNVGDTPNIIVIPAKTKFSAKCGIKTFTFYNLESALIKPYRGIYSFNGLTVYEGRFVKERFIVSSGNDRFILSNSNVDLNKVSVRVNRTTFSNQFEDYTYKTNIFGATKDDNVFYIQPYLDDTYEVTFGKNVFGYQPIIGDIIEIEYLVTSGSEANGANSFISDTISSYPAQIILAEIASGGADEESIDSIKFSAPKSIQIQERAVTTSDYEILLKNHFTNIDSISVYGGETASPPQYGRVIIAINLKDNKRITSADIQTYKTFLKDKISLAIDTVFITPGFMKISITSNVLYDAKKTLSTSNDILTTVRNSVSVFNETYLNDFKSAFRYSRFLYAIDNSDQSIISNDTLARAYFELYPASNVAETISLKYENELKSATSKNITSSPFLYKGVTSYLADNGLGTIDIVNSLDNLTYVQKNIGTVDYLTGEVKLNNFAVDSYYGDSLKIYATVKAEDIYAPSGKILTIDINNVDISVDAK